jgi:hypothetical protein
MSTSKKVDWKKASTDKNYATIVACGFVTVSFENVLDDLLLTEKKCVWTVPAVVRIAKLLES